MIIQQPLAIDAEPLLSGIAFRAITRLHNDPRRGFEAATEIRMLDCRPRAIVGDTGSAQCKRHRPNSAIIAANSPPPVKLDVKATRRDGK